MPSTSPAPVAPVIYLVAVDAAANAAHVVDVACGLGVALGGAAELHLVHVLAVSPPSFTGPAIASAELLDAGKRLLDEASARAAARFGGRIVGHLASGEPARVITSTAAQLNADLVVVGTASKTGLTRLALGSVAETVVRTAGCPVLVVRPKGFHADAPQIEPACEDCLRVQATSKRASLWCERHAARQAHGRLHYEVPPSFAMGSMLIRPS